MRIPRKGFKKPEFPPYFSLVNEDGEDDGPFLASTLVPSTLDGNPWVIADVGSPRVFRVLKQEGDVLHTADSGKLHIVELNEHYQPVRI